MSDNLRDNLANTTRQGSAELALRRHGLTTPELQRLAHAAAEAGLKRMQPPPPLDHGEREDLVSALLEAGLRWALVYDINQDAKRNFATSVYSRMRLRVTDWCRTNIHDARFGTSKRHMAIDPAEWTQATSDVASPWHPDSDPEGDHFSNFQVERAERKAPPTLPWANSTRDAFIEPDFQDTTVNRMQTDRWQAAAHRAGIPLEQWIARTLDAAAELEDAA